MLRILHTADWQLGKYFGNIEGDAGAALRQQRFQTVRAIAELAQARAVDAVLVAGDVFDLDSLSNTLLLRTLEALQPYSGPWLLLPGNHDPATPESLWTRLRALGAPANVHLLTEPGVTLLANGGLAVLAAPLQRRHDSQDLSAVFQQLNTPATALRVGLAHGGIDGFLGNDWQAFNRIAANRAELAQLDYLALGDWHGTLPINPRTWYAGTPEPDRFKDNDAGNVLYVELEAGQLPRVERIPIGYYHWSNLELSLNSAEDLLYLDDQLTQLGHPARQVLRLHLNGALSLHQRAQLQQQLQRWEARLHYLQVNEHALGVQASAQELDALTLQGGFIATAVHTLRQLSQQTQDPHQQSLAIAALQRLYQLTQASSTHAQE